MVTEGKAAKSRRLLHDISQEVVAAWVGISQRQYSYFESGRARLSVAQIKTLQSRFESLDKGEGFVDLARPLNLLREDEFLSVQQKMLEKWKYTDLWLFGLRHLPVLRESSYRQIWVENLANGINYRIVWFLDEELELSRFVLFQNTVSEILDGLNLAMAGKQTSPGQLKLYGAKIGDEEKSKLEGALRINCDRFKKLKTHLETHFKKYAEVIGPEDIGSPDFEKCRSILHYGWLRSVVCYEGERGVNSFAAVLSENVSNDPKCSGSGESGWTFLTRSPTATLLAHIHEFAEKIVPKV